MYPLARMLYKNSRAPTSFRRSLSGGMQEFFIHEVTPRDGLQNEKAVLTVDQKLNLIEGLVKSNPASIEVCSFVREDRVPAMAGSAELVQQLSNAGWATDAKARGMHFAALVPNQKGFEAFHNVASPILDTVVVLTSCTESHSKANVGMGLATALKTTCDIIKDAKAEGYRVLAFASLAFGCPFEGNVDPIVVRDIVNAYSELDVDRIVLADTQGKAKPDQVDVLLSPEVLKPSIGRDRIGMHMHNTNGLAHANVLQGVRNGIKHFDSSIGGCGGCNFLPGAQGNISTQSLLKTIEEEMLVHTKEGSRLLHGMDHAEIHKVHVQLESALGNPLPFEYEKGVLEVFDVIQ